MSRSYKANNPYTILRSLNCGTNGADLRRAQAKAARQDEKKALKNAKRVSK